MQNRGFGFLYSFIKYVWFKAHYLFKYYTFYYNNVKQR